MSPSYILDYIIQALVGITLVEHRPDFHQNFNQTATPKFDQTSTKLRHPHRSKSIAVSTHVYYFSQTNILLIQQPFNRIVNVVEYDISVCFYNLVYIPDYCYTKG